MPRSAASRRPRGASVLSMRAGTLVLAVLGSACGSCGGDDPLKAPPAPVAPPEGIRAEAWITGTGALLRGLEEQSGSELVRQMLPRSAGDLATRISGLPATVAERIPIPSALYVLAVEREGHIETALAVDMPRGVELGSGIPLVEGGPGGSRFLVRAPGEGQAAQVLAGEAIVWAESRALLEAVLPYARAQLRREGPPAVRIRVPAGVAGGPLRRELEARLEEFVRSSRANLQKERARHEGAPALGDPEVLLERGAAEARELFAYLPDVGAIEATLTASPAGTTLDARAKVETSSPLGRAIAAHPAGPAYGLSSLPQSTALAFSERRTAAGSPALFDLLRALGGARIDAAAEQALTAAGTEYALEAGAPSVLAFGGNTRGGWVAYGRGPIAEGADAASLARLFAVPYVAELTGALEGCDGPARLGAFADIEGLVVAPLCARTEPPYPVAQLARHGHAWVFGLSTQADLDAAPHPAIRELSAGLAGRTEGLLSDDPDAARALGALNDPVLFGAVFLPSRSFAALGLFAAPVVRRLAAALGTPPSISPTVLALRGEDAGLRLDVRVAPRGIDRYAELGLVVARVFGGEPEASPTP